MTVPVIRSTGLNVTSVGGCGTTGEEGLQECHPTLGENAWRSLARTKHLTFNTFELIFVHPLLGCKCCASIITGNYGNTLLVSVLYFKVLLKSGKDILLNNQVQTLYRGTYTTTSSLAKVTFCIVSLHRGELNALRNYPRLPYSSVRKNITSNPVTNFNLQLQPLYWAYTYYECPKKHIGMAYIIPTIPFIGNLPTPIIRVLDTTAWNLTSPDGSQVERYIVEFECRVRNMTFVEKYMSVSASGGTGRVATNESCSGGLGQLYRVKVWAVSGPNISQQPAVKLVNTGTVSTWYECVLCSVHRL